MNKKMFYIANKGIKDSIIRIFDKIGISVYKMHYMKIKIDYKFVNSKLNVSDLNVKKLCLKDLELFNLSKYPKDKISIFKKRFKSGSYLAYGVFNNEEIIYSTWISLKEFSLPVKTLETLSKHEALLEDSYCDPSFRGKGIHGKMNLFRLKKIYEEGRTEAVVVVLNGNEHAINVQIKSGFKDVGTFYIGKIFKYQFNTLKKEKYDLK